MLILPNAWAWDLWTAVDGERLHLFSLNAPRDLGDPELRHRFAGVGHAVSADLRTWELLPEALTAGAPGGPDDLAIWTGCVVAGCCSRSTIGVRTTRSSGRSATRCR